MPSIKDCSADIKKLKNLIADADAVLIGAGSGLSSAAGLTYSGERFTKYFADFKAKYNITDMYSGGFYPFESLEVYWAWWSRHIWYNRYADEENGLYKTLLNLVKDKDYFVLTTNVDHCFQKAGFSKNRLFYTQGDYGLFQCSAACHKKTYDNKDIIKEMLLSQRDMKVPSYLIPYCPVCGKPMTVNLRCDDKFVEDEGWHRAMEAYVAFKKKARNKKLLLIELGVGLNTPVIIKYPFWQMAYNSKNIFYVCINNGEAVCPEAIKKQSLCINDDINNVINAVAANLPD